MRAIKIAAIIFVLSGLVILGIGLQQLRDVQKQGKRTVEEARELVQRGEAAADLEQFDPETGEAAGLLLIPRLGAELAIVEGTDPDDLEKGVGHYKGSYYPEENGQIVLSGHRDTVFRKAGELEIGDLFRLKMPYGEFTYELVATKVVPADDTSIITLQNREEELILTTCYPFSFIGNAPDRYIMYAKRIQDGGPAK